MAKLPEFGFSCGHFEVALTANKFVVPGSRGTLKKSLIPTSDPNDAAGIYRLTVQHEGSTVFKSNVHVYWLGHDKEPQPFLGFKCDDPDAVADALRPYTGKPVQLKFELVGDGRTWTQKP